MDINFAKIYHFSNNHFFTEKINNSFNNSKVEIEVFHDDELINEFKFIHDCFENYNSNWNGRMIYIWAYLIAQAGYKVSFAPSLDTDIHSHDFSPIIETFFDDYDFPDIEVSVIYSREFYLENPVRNEIYFKDIPKEFHFELYGIKHCLISSEYENLYEYIVKNLMNVSEFKVLSN